MTRHVFPVVRVHAIQEGLCPVCDRPSKRAQVFEQTVNPWNRNADGTPKTKAEIHEELMAQASNWHPDFTHLKCSTQPEGTR